jgi:hypothetical protein
MIGRLARLLVRRWHTTHLHELRWRDRCNSSSA